MKKKVICILYLICNSNSIWFNFKDLIQKNYIYVIKHYSLLNHLPRFSVILIHYEFSLGRIDAKRKRMDLSCTSLLVWQETQFFFQFEILDKLFHKSHLVNSMQFVVFHHFVCLQNASVLRPTTDIMWWLYRTTFRYLNLFLLIYFIQSLAKFVKILRIPFSATWLGLHSFYAEFLAFHLS